MASDARRAAEALDVSLIVRAWIAGSVCKHDLNTKNCGLCMMAQIKVMIDAARAAGYREGVEAAAKVCDARRDKLIETAPAEHRQYGARMGEAIACAEEIRALLSPTSSKEHCPRRLMGEHQEPHAPCDTGDFSKECAGRRCRGG